MWASVFNLSWSCKLWICNKEGGIREVCKLQKHIEKHKKINNRASKFTKIPNVPNDSNNTSGSPFNYNLTILFILTMKEFQYLQLDGRKPLKCCTKCVPHFFEKLHQGASLQAQISEHPSFGSQFVWIRNT